MLRYPLFTCAVSTFHGLVAFGPHWSTATSQPFSDMAESEAAIPKLFQVGVKDKPADK